MSKPDWGTKLLCQSCGTKFYDLQRTPATCPSCGVEVDRESPLKSRRTRSATPKPAPAEPVKKPKSLDDEDGDDGKETDLDDADLVDADLDDADLGDNVSDDDDDDGVMEDTSELGDDDMSDVISSTEDDNDDDR